MNVLGAIDPSIDGARALVIALFAAPVLAAALWDLATYRIPSWLTGGLAGTFVPTAVGAAAPLRILRRGQGIPFGVSISAAALWMAPNLPFAA